MKTLWKLENIRFGPVARPRLICDVLEIPAGTTAVLGQSGAGKTSLLNLLVDFERPQQGQVVSQIQVSGDRLPLSWVPPDFGLWPHLNVKDQLLAVSAGDSWLVEQLIAQFDLTELGQHKPSMLSLGEQSRLAVARSLASKALVHVMDEPFAHVDPGRVDRYWSVLRDTLQANHAALVFSSHAPAAVMREADHIICLEQGRIPWSGSPKELYSSPPSRSLALLLGPVNWFDGELQRGAGDLQEVTCVRPEALTLVENQTGELVVRNSWFVGPHQQTEVEVQPSGHVQTLYHQPADSPLRIGMHVSLKLLAVCLMLLATLISNGCRSSKGDEPALRPETSRQYLLPAEEAMLPAARGMTFSPNGDLLILDNVGRVLAYGGDGELIAKWWMPDYDIGRPEGICVLQDGRIAVADTHYNRVVLFNDQCDVVGLFGENGGGEGQFIYTSAIAQDDEQFLYVAEYGGNDRIQKFTVDGEFVMAFGSVGSEDGQFQRPSGLVWHEETLYVADAINNRIQAFDRNGQFLRVVADAHTTGLYYPYDISLGMSSENGEDSLFIVEYGAGRLTQVSLTGELLGRYGQEGRGEGQFWTPWGVAANHEGKVAIADTGNRRVVELQLK